MCDHSLYEKPRFSRYLQTDLRWKNKSDYDMILKIDIDFLYQTIYTEDDLGGGFRQIQVLILYRFCIFADNGMSLRE